MLGVNEEITQLTKYLLDNLNEQQFFDSMVRVAAASDKRATAVALSRTAFLFVVCNAGAAHPYVLGGLGSLESGCSTGSTSATPGRKSDSRPT